MFYHALTGKNVEPTEDLSPVLLWENSDITATFEAQTISLDLTDYAGVIIEYNQDTTTNQKLSGRLYIKKGESNIGSGQTYTPNQANARNITQINNNGVTFGNAISSNDVSSNIFIPTKIYGIKKYIVEPQVGDLLWTNSAPTSELSETTISGDYTKYSRLRVKYRVKTTINAVFETMAERNENNAYNGVYGVVPSDGSYYRAVILSDTSILIKDATKVDGSTNVTTNNAGVVVTEIYGIE